MSDLNMLSPLAEFSTQNHVHAQLNGVALAELPMMEHFNVRLQANDANLLDEIEDALEISIPLKPNTFVIAENNLCAWLGPDEWLIISPLDRADRVEAGLRAQMDTKFATLVKLGSAQTIFRVSGNRARDFLSRGIAIDLDPVSFHTNSCAQTVLAHINVLVLNQSQAEPALDIVVRRSYADHLWRWLLDVGAEAEFRL